MFDSHNKCRVGFYLMPCEFVHVSLRKTDLQNLLNKTCILEQRKENSPVPMGRKNQQVEEELLLHFLHSFAAAVAGARKNLIIKIKIAKEIHSLLIFTDI